MLTRAIEHQGKVGDLNVRALHHANRSLWKSAIPGQKVVDEIKEAELRQDLEAREQLDEAKRRRQQGFGQSQRVVQSTSRQTLGGGLSAEHRNKFVLESEDEEQEERIENKTQQLAELIRGVRQDTEQIGEVIVQQNAVIDSLGHKVWGSLTIP